MKNRSLKKITVSIVFLFTLPIISESRAEPTSCQEHVWQRLGDHSIPGAIIQAFGLQEDAHGENALNTVQIDSAFIANHNIPVLDAAGALRGGNPDGPEKQQRLLEIPEEKRRKLLHWRRMADRLNSLKGQSAVEPPEVTSLKRQIEDARQAWIDLTNEQNTLKWTSFTPPDLLPTKNYLSNRDHPYFNFEIGEDAASGKQIQTLEASYFSELINGFRTGRDNTMGYQFEVVSSHPSETLKELSIIKNPRKGSKGFHVTYEFEIKNGSCEVSKKIHRELERENGEIVEVSRTEEENPKTSTDAFLEKSLESLKGIDLPGDDAPEPKPAVR